jgi:hypothetical protein
MFYNNKYPNLSLHEDPVIDKILALENTVGAICGMQIRHTYNCKTCQGTINYFIPEKPEGVWVSNEEHCSYCNDGEFIKLSNKMLDQVHKKITDTFSLVSNKKYLIDLMFDGITTPKPEEK